MSGYSLDHYANDLRMGYYHLSQGSYVNAT